MNRGINDSRDLPREYLEAIFDEIAQNEIQMSVHRHRASTSKLSMAGGVCVCVRESLGVRGWAGYGYAFGFCVYPRLVLCPDIHAPPPRRKNVWSSNRSFS